MLSLKKKKLNGRMVALLCAACGSHLRHTVGYLHSVVSSTPHSTPHFFHVSLSAWEHQPKGRNFSSPTSVLEISFCLGSVKQNSPGLVSLAFGEGLMGERNNFCCYTQISWTPHRPDSGQRGSGTSCTAWALD